MKSLLKCFILTVATCLFTLRGQSQKLFYPCSLYNVPALAPNDYHSVALSYMGFKRVNHAILVKMRLPGDTIYYTVPGVLPSGDSFGFIIKTGNRNSSDTLYLVHREGENSIKLEEVLVLVFHRSYRLFSFRNERSFTNVVLTHYYNSQTRSWIYGKENSVILREREYYEPPNDILPARYATYFQETNLISFKKR